MRYSESKEILLSIIVPIYNAFDNLEKCLESLHKVECGNIEILLTDDGSTDDSSSICKKFAAKDKRFCYIHKDNGGASSARNFGLNNSRGKYIGFVDSDDYIDSENFVSIIRLLKKDVECLIFGYTRNGILKNIGLSNIRNVNRATLLEDLKKPEFANDFGYVWNKIYKKELIEANNVVFDEAIFEREDFLFNIDYFKHINNITILEECLYYYIQYEESLSRRKKDKTFLDVFINALDEKLKNNYLSESITIEDVALELMADYIVNSVFKICKNYKDIKTEFKELLFYDKYIYKSQPYNLYLKILKYCFKSHNIQIFYLYYKLSILKKKIKTYCKR